MTSKIGHNFANELSTFVFTMNLFFAMHENVYVIVFEMMK